MSQQRTRRPLSPDLVRTGVRLQKPPAHGSWAGSQEGLVSSVTSPSTHRRYRVFHLPTLSEASTIRKRLMRGDARRESRYPRKPRCDVDPPGRSLT